MKNFVDHFFIARIDRALDDQVAPDRLTRWYLQFRPELQEYYLDMMELELELRFPEDVSSEPVRISKSELSFKRDRYVSRIGILALICAVLLSGWVLLNYFTTRFTPVMPIEMVRNIPVATEIQPDEQDGLESRIDLGILWDSTLTALNTLGPASVPVEAERPAVDSADAESLTPIWFPNGQQASPEMIVAFTEKPLEMTVTFLSFVGVLDRKQMTP